MILSKPLHLSLLIHRPKFDKHTLSLTPNSIEWWAWIEKKYSRKVIKSDKNEYTNIGFFGASKEYVYQTWADELEEINEEVLIKLSEEDSWNMDGI
jgi:hypothetical protein